MGIPTVNIGDRQKGRIQADSIVNCEPDVSAIKEAMEKAETAEFKGKIAKALLLHKQSDALTSKSIVSRIKECLLGENREEIDLKKKFYDIEFEV